MRQSINIMRNWFTIKLSTDLQDYLRGHGGPTTHDDNNNTHLTASFQDNPGKASIGMYSTVTL